MLHVALWEPEIPPNTGNIARLCAATGATLHLIGRIGFRLDDRHLRRAGCDYWPDVTLRSHATLDDFAEASKTLRVYPVSTRGSVSYTRPSYAAGDCFLFGSESKGLPPSVHDRYAGHILTIPMPAGRVRSLNLATAVGIVLYEALRQLHDW
jgi:tRNA (cytidine/uridine-2'-O-)-methyltransferase